MRGPRRSHSQASTCVATGYRPRSVIASDSRVHGPTNTQCGWGRGARTGLEKGPTRRSARRPRKQTDPRWTANASPSGVRCRGGRATDWTAAHAHGGPWHRRHRARSAPDLQGTSGSGARRGSGRSGVRRGGPAHWRAAPLARRRGSRTGARRAAFAREGGRAEV